MDTLFSLKVFRHVVQNGSFTRAAEQLDISTAMASKHVSHLENTIQAKLLHRNSRNLHLTEAGEEYYRQCSYALDTLDTAAQKAAGGAEKPQGMLRVTMPLWFANNLLSGWLVEYCERYPEVTLDLVLDNRHVDLIAEGFDLALRVSKTPAPSLIVKPLSRIEFALVASPEYLQRHGTPATPEEAMQHKAVLPSYANLRNVEITHTASGAKSTLSLKPVILTDHTLMVRELVKAGGGLGYQPIWAVYKDLEEGKLVRLLPDYTMLDEQLNAAYVDRAFLSAKVRSFIDFINEKIHQANCWAV
ncbi:LysR family transcriptional regulator [Neisseria sp. CCUG12390]|uniref:LysR family transcriptional regulator n=1 Tax=Neisseria sp. CCUG12390 TaxID=3392035 RepID=UPI003A0FCBC2